MNARLARIIDWVFEGSSEASPAPSATSASRGKALPRAEDRARYDSGTAFFGG
jgi:hypothetical protein